MKQYAQSIGKRIILGTMGMMYELKKAIEYYAKIAYK